MSAAARATRPPVNWAYVGLLALNSILLGIVGWFSIETVRDVKTSVSALVESDRKTREEIAALRAQVETFVRQGFVSRDLYEQRRAEMDRMNSAQDEALKDLRRQIEEMRKQ